jgi:hypothetical protein
MFSSMDTIAANQQLGLQGQQLVGEVIAHHPDIVGMVRVRLRGIHDKWPEDCIPWSRAEEGSGTGNNQSGSKKPTPPIGAKVYGKFLSNNQYHPTYSEGPPSDDKKVPGVNDSNDIYGHKDEGGHSEVTNIKEGAESWLRSHLKGTNFGIDKDGKMNFNVADAIQHIAKEIIHKATGGLTMEGSEGHIKVAGKLIFEAASMEFRHGGATTSMPIMPGASGPQAPTAPTLPKAGERPKFAAVGDSVGGEKSS